MNRVRAVLPAVATAAATAAAGVILGTAPAYAARTAHRQPARPHTAQRHAAEPHGARMHAGQRHANQPHAGQVRAGRAPFAQQGMYVSVLKCSGRHGLVLTAPVTPNADLEFKNGSDPQNVKIVAKPPRSYRQVFTCTVVVLRKPGKPRHRHRVVVVLDTGFGGAARTVARHHPAN